MNPSISRVILYVKDMARTAEFYRRYFGMIPLPTTKNDWMELVPEGGGCSIALHKASVSQKSGAAIKIVFGVADVNEFKKKSEEAGLKFGVIHQTDGFEFANAKDPSGNSIQISSRGLA